MTGRALYDRFCDARAANSSWGTPQEQLPHTPVAWPMLHWREKSLWNAMASRLTPKPRRKAVRS